MTRRLIHRLLLPSLALLLVAAMACVAVPSIREAMIREVRSRMGRHSVESRMAELKPRIAAVWRDRALKAGFAELPANILIVVLKDEKQLHVFGGEPGDERLLASYPVLAASGTAGPKLREGDRQVPEGFYAVESLNPNSRFHLALRVNYPSTADRDAATAERRTNLGGDIMIHGGAGSIGCVAIGDPAIEEVFTLAALVGISNVEIIMTPSGEPVSHVTSDTPTWVAERYRAMDARLRTLRWEGRGK